MEEYGWKEFFKDCYNYCRTHSLREIVVVVYRSGHRYYSENPLDFAALIISLISLGLSSAAIVIEMLSPQ
mgnify:FL=1